MALVHSESNPPTPDEITSPLLQVPPPVEPPQLSHGFVSLRWRLLLPLTSVILIVSIIGAYAISRELVEGTTTNAAEDLNTDTDNILAEWQLLADTHSRELFRLQNTGGFEESLAARNVQRLEALISPNALLAELDVVIVTDRRGIEIIGLQQADSDTLSLEVSQQGNLQNIRSVDELLAATARTTELAHIDDRLILLSGTPVIAPDNRIMGTLLVGTDVAPLLAELSIETNTEILVFDGSGQWIAGVAAGTPSANTEVLSVLSGTDYSTQRIVEDDLTKYTTYAPLSVNGISLGVLQVTAEESGETLAEMTQHVVSLSSATAAAAIVISAYLLIARLIQRLEYVRDSAVALADGGNVRIGLPPTDEIGELATALDYYADVMEYEQSALSAKLQLHLRETKRLKAIIENVSDGLIVLDPHGRPLTMNAAARRLLGIHAEFDLRDLYEQIFDALGTAIAPGIYALGNPVRIRHDHRTLQAETAAVVGHGEQRLGVIVTLRDISVEVQREAHYEKLITKLASDIQLSMAYTAQGAALEAARDEDTNNQDALFEFARDVARNAHALQGVIDEMRDLQSFAPSEIERVQRPLLLSELLWDTATQWQKAIHHANMHLSMVIPDENSHILGDSRRLLWAFGNIIDNAIRYSEAGSDLLIVSDIVQDGQTAHLIFRDSGVGILPEDLPHVFDRFFRGEIRHVGNQTQIAGSGQGLYQSKRIIEAHGGSISIESTVNVGTTVHIWLPLTASVSLPVRSSTQKEMRGTAIVPRIFRDIFEPDPISDQ